MLGRVFQLGLIFGKRGTRKQEAEDKEAALPQPLQIITKAPLGLVFQKLETGTQILYENQSNPEVHFLGKVSKTSGFPELHSRQSLIRPQR